MRQYKIDEAIQYSLALRIDKSSDVRFVSDAIVTLWQEVVGRLEPIIGDRGTEVVFSRSLYLTNKEFPWIVLADNTSSSATQIQLFLESFEGRDSNLLSKASYKLLSTFSQLLASLIGEPLTQRLLTPVLIADTAEN
ncbi:MAG TPA: hypothetical protein VK949_06550 [Methylotenera sp.]|nr:hypothetical protein [Methylotenera sp.]